MCAPPFDVEAPLDDIRSAIERRAAELGFSRASIVPVRRPPTAPQFEQWLREGRQGEMDYLEKWREIRVGEAELEPGLASVVVLLTNYHRPIQVTDGGWKLARYALGEDYHAVLRDRLDQLAAFIHAETGAEVGTRAAVDTAPVLERDLAARAGLGWVGKNAMVIDTEIGSYTFVSELYVDVDLGGEERRHPDRCGTCSACIDACPTGAIVAPHVVDARRCISYLTIELRGPIPRALRPLIGDHLFGCDICQDVCPWNRHAPESTDDAFQMRDGYQLFELRDLIRFPHSWYVEVFRGSAVKRAKYRGLLRNAAVVMGNRADPGDVPALAEALQDNEEPLVRGHVAWALGRIGTPAALAAIEAALDVEEDPYVLDELRSAHPSPNGGSGAIIS